MKNKITRKDFLKTTALSSFGLFPSSWSNRLMGGYSAGKVTVGAHPWVYAAKLPEHDITPVLDQIFADMSYAGMDGVELMHHPLRSSETTGLIGELKEKYNLPVIGTSYGADMWDWDQHKAILKDAETVITNLAKIGGRTLGTSVRRPSSIKTSDQLDAQAELLKQIISICKDNGVVLNLHNHTYEVENDMHDLKGTLSRIPNIKLGPDLNWLVRAGIDPVNFVNRFGNKIVFMHLRDQYANGQWTEYLGQGNTDFVAIAQALRKINFTGDAIIELAHEKDFERTLPLRESLKKSREFVRRAMR